MDLSKYDLIAVNVLRRFWLNANFSVNTRPRMQCTHFAHSPVFTLRTPLMYSLLILLSFRALIRWLPMAETYLVAKASPWIEWYSWFRPNQISTYMKSNGFVSHAGACVLCTMIQNGISRWKMSYQVPRYQNALWFVCIIYTFNRSDDL